MRIALVASALAWALALAGGIAQAAPARAEVEACATEMFRDAARADQDSRCTPVIAAFKAQPGSASLQTNPDTLRDWAMTLPSPVTVPRPAPDPAAVAGVLAHMAQEQAGEPLSLWQRFRRWLHSLFDSDQQQKAPDWLLKLFEALGKIPQKVVQTTFWGLVAMLAVFLLALIVIELRASGVFGTRRRRRSVAAAVPAGMTAAPVAEPELTLDDIAGLPAERRAPALLRWLLRALVERRLLAADKALTNRELAARLPPPVAAGFRHFVRCIEPALYGGLLLHDDAFAEARARASGAAGGVAGTGTAPVAAADGARPQ